MISQVKVIHAANSHTFDVGSGTTVLAINRNLADAFNLPMSAVAYVNGERIGSEYVPRSGETLEFVVADGRKGSGSLDEMMSVIERNFPLEKWDEEATELKQSLFLDSNSYEQPVLFDLPPVPPDQFSEKFLVSPNASFAYQNRILLKGRPLDLHGIKNGMVVFNGDVVIPSLIDMTVDHRDGEPFRQATSLDVRAKWGAVWMSLTPGEMLTQRPGVIRANGTVLIGGLGLGWLLRKVCEKNSVDRVIVVEQSQELLDWYGYDLCKRYPKVSDVICDDVYNQIGKHGADVKHLLDIWLLFSDSTRDRRLLPFRRKLKKQVWAWGQQ